MEEKKFTLRLNSVEISALEALKRDLKEQTDSRTIRFVLMNYGELNRRYLAEKKEKAVLAEQLRTLKGRVTMFFDTFNDLKKML